MAEWKEEKRLFVVPRMRKKRGRGVQWNTV